MNFFNASGFLFSGVVMGILPLIAPGLCPLNGMDGSSARELWLQLMGTINTSVGAVYLLRTAGLRVSAFWTRTVRPLVVPSGAKPYALPREAFTAASGR